MSIGKPVAGVCVSTALFVCSAAGYPQPSAQLPPSSGTLILNESVAGGAPAPITAGGTFTIRGDGFAGNAAVSIVVYSTPRQLGTAVADAAGRVDASVALPTDLTGRHTLTALGNGADGSPRSLQTSVDVRAATQSALPFQTLPRTGLNVVGMLVGALGLIVAGFALVRTAAFRRPLSATR